MDHGGAPGAETAALPDAGVTVHRSAKGPTLATTTGAVVVISGKNTSQPHASQPQQQHYQLPAAAKDHVAAGGKPAFFLAVLAPNADAALQFLANRPPGAHLLVKDEDENLTLYVKFRQAVRAIVIVKAKELKKHDDAIAWGRPYRAPPDGAAPGSAAPPLPQTHSTMLTPVHRLYLPPELYASLEQCWKRFLPQVKAILLQMCCEPSLDEDIKLDDWGAVVSSAQTPCIIALTAQTCGFYLIGTNSSAAANGGSSSSSSGTLNGSSSSSAVPVRHVELDFQKHVIVVADGTFNPSAFIVSTHFASKKLFDADLTFKTLRDNFLAPDRVMIKETTVATMPVQQTMWQNCVELNSSDPEFTLLASLESICWSIVPHEPLPDSLLDALRNLHVFFAESYGATTSADSRNRSNTATWPKEKIRMAAQIFPYLLELLVAAASGLEAIEASASTSNSGGSHRNVHKANSVSSFLFPPQKLKLLHQFARVMRFDIVHMLNRCDDAMLYKVAHHIFQFYSMRCDLPAEFIELVRDLLTLAPEFRALFLKNQGANLLWKALHTGDRFQLGSAKTIAGISPLAQAIMHANAQAVPAKPKAAAERRSSLFGLGKKAQPTKSRKSIDFGTTFAIPVVSHVKPLVFLRLNPLLVQSELIAKLCRGHLEVPHDKVEANSVGATYAFCYCSEVAHARAGSSETSHEAAKKSLPHRAGIYSSCKRKKRFKLSPKMCMYELVLQLALEFLYSSSAKTWDRDVGLLLRLENIHGSLTNEVLQQIKDAAAGVSIDDIVLTPDDVLLEPDSYCRIRVVVACVSTLYRLELKRRNQAKMALGDKKYWYLIHLFRTELREFNEYLESCAENDSDNDNDESEADDRGSETDNVSDSGSDSAAQTRRTELLAHIAMFRWIPRSLVDEWVVLSLEDFLQTVTNLSTLLERTEATGSTNLEHVQYACQLLQIFQLVMNRSTDGDVQTLLVRVLNRGCFPITALLRQLATVALTFGNLVDKRTSYSIQTAILSFLNAFVTLDVALPSRNAWTQRNPDAGTAKSEDVEVLEQHKGALMASVLTLNPRTGADEPSLWEYMVLSLVERSAVSSLGDEQREWARIPTLSAVKSFQQLLEPLELSHKHLAYFHLVEAFLELSAKFYTSVVPDSVAAQSDFAPCVASHMHYITLYSRRYSSSASEHDSPALLQRVTEMHLACLIALATRRAQLPAITAAFTSSRAVSTLLELVQPASKSCVAPSSTLSSARAGSAALDAGHDTSSQTATLDSCSGASALSDAPCAVHPLAPSLRLNLSHVQKSIPRLDAQLPSGSGPPARRLLLQPDVHALVIVLTASFLILEPNYELDEALSPSLFDRSIYVRPSAPLPADTEPPHTDAESAATASVLSSGACVYLAKGAFSTVYRATPLLPRAGAVAIKVLAHQARPGDLSVLHSVYSEVSILKRLQGESAATQLLDYGNHHDAQSFELVMEYCPCTLTQWRATVSAAPFRSLLVMVLRAFEYSCQALARIHREGVGHFDVKGDNVLLRTAPHDATRRLLLFEERESYESEATRFLNTCFCFGDFGESMVAESEVQVPRTTSFSVMAGVAGARVSSFQAVAPAPSASPPKEAAVSSCFFLSRTRGTEAIKSPEMLQISGADGKRDKVTLACDLWSMGCLFYELLTQELLFGNDDAAGLYTHLVINKGRVLRDEHGATISAALAPKDEQERLLVVRLVAVCEKMLARSPSSRLSLNQMLVEVRRLLEDVLALTKSPDDKKYLELVLASGETESSALSPSTLAADAADAQTTVSLLDLPSRRDRFQALDIAPPNSDEHWSSRGLQSLPRITASRFFSNLHIGGLTTDAVSAYVQALTRAGAGDRATSATMAFMDAVEAAHEATYDQFVYFLCDSDSNARFDAHATDVSSAQSAPSLVNEVSEEAGRTCLFISASWIALRRRSTSSSSGTTASASISTTQRQPLDLDIKFFRQVDLDSSKLFPVIQRLLRQAPGSVLLLGVGRDAHALELMNEVVTSTLLFFLQSALGITTAEALTFVARDCGQVFGYPSASRLFEFETYAMRHDDALRRVQAREKITHRRYVAHCLCGESAYGVHVDAIKEAMYHQQQQCSRSALSHSNSAAAAVCLCFHPFPALSVSESSSEQLPVRDTYDVQEERLLFPLEAQSCRGDEVVWVEVDIRALERLDSLFGADVLTSSDGHGGSSTNAGSSAGAASGTAAAAPLSSRATQQSARSSAPLILSFRDLRKRRRRQTEEQAQLAGVGEHCEQLASGPSAIVSALTLGLKERAYSPSMSTTAVVSSLASSAATSTPTGAAGATAKPRKLFECELCCFPICAISSDHEKVAIPLYLRRRAAG